MTERYRFEDNERALMEGSGIPFAVYQLTDGKMYAVLFSAGFLDLFGYSDRESAAYDVDNDIYKDAHPDDTAHIIDATLRFAKAETRGQRYDVVYRSINKERTGYNIIHAIGERVDPPTGEKLAYVWYIYEGSYSGVNNDAGLTSEIRNALHEEIILNESRYDHLTGLPGMTYFFELAIDGRDSMLKDGRSPALLFMDLCGMKYFNHRHGFAEGDSLLKAFAKVLARYFGNEGCCRIGEDHFSVISEEAGLETKLSELLEECRWINGGLSLPVHIGIYLNRTETIGAGAACDRAKLACDSIRSANTSEFRYYDSSMKENEEKRQYIISNLDKAISEQWIKVYYQPIVRAVNGRVCDEEALARWIDPVRGLLSPADFIPILEDCGLICKLDLYILDRVLEKLKTLKDAGLHLVPQSINLSRSDFSACDIVEEIRRRVDEAGISRSLITIEVTESIVGSDFEFMKERTDRFRGLGFPVWMDDFGSGYSSLDVLQSIKFDLIKFDMRFLQDFGNSDGSKIILTQLIKMATFLGIDTVCEGVETEEQVDFLREAGCSKLQGYFYSKPLPLERILERYRNGTQIGFEDPAEAKYFDTVGRVNLHDISVINQDGSGETHNFFNMLPMAVIELGGEELRVVRSNRSFRDFIGRYRKSAETAKAVRQGVTPILSEIIRKCSNDGGRVFVEVRMPDNANVHYFVRSIASDPCTGTKAVVVAVLSIADAEKVADYANIARALAADYFNLYYVDLETEDFIEYSSGVGKEDLAVERHGKNFFFESRRDALEYLCQEDREPFIAAFRKEKILRALEEQGTFTLTYRLLKNGEPLFVNMKVMPMRDNGRHIIIGVSSIDSQMRQKRELESAERDRIAFSRIAALSGKYICMYTVDPATGIYSEYSASGEYEGLGLEKSGNDFFASAIEDGAKALVPEDFPEYCRVFTKENVLREIKENGRFTMRYRLIIAGQPIPVTLSAALVRESDGEKLIVGVRMTD